MKKALDCHCFCCGNEPDGLLYVTEKVVMWESVCESCAKRLGCSVEDQSNEVAPDGE